MKPRDAECHCGGASPLKRPNAKAPRYGACCSRFIEGGAFAANAMEMMRSRYTAYVLGNTAYLRAMWDPATYPPDLDVSDTSTCWLGLEIKRHTPRATAQSSGRARA